MSFTAQPAEPRGARWRAGVVALIGVFALGLAAVAPVAAAPAVPGPGFTDFVYKPDVDGTGGDDVTSFRNQSKLWFNDGRWWGILFDKGSAPNGTFRIQSLTMATQTWTTSATATQVDNRNRAASDALWDGTNLWVVSSQDHGRNWSPNGDVRLFKYTYSSATKTYSPVDLNPSPTATYKLLASNGADPGGTPLPKAPGRDAATIAKAPDGSLWVSWMQQIDPTLPKPSPANIMVMHGNAAGTTWGGAIVLPVEGTAPTTDDMVAIASVGTTASHRGVGVLWSNQTGGAEGFYFAAHTDGAADGSWETRETVDSGVGSADGHISLKTETSTGRIIAAVKTNKTTGTDPLIEVLARTGNSDAAGSWSIHPVSSDNQHGSRPVLVLDNENYPGQRLHHQHRQPADHLPPCRAAEHAQLRSGIDRDGVHQQRRHGDDQQRDLDQADDRRHVGDRRPRR